MYRSLILISSLLLAFCSYAQQEELAFRDEIRAPDNWELIIEYHTQNKSITSSVMESYRENNYSLLKREYSTYCDCKDSWTSKAIDLDLPLTAAYIPLLFNSDCTSGLSIISALSAISGRETELVDELNRIWVDVYANAEQFDHSLYELRIFMRLVENLNMPEPQAASPKRHLVLEGETLYRLSVNYGVSVEKIQEANNLGSSTSIKSGTYLTIP